MVANSRILINKYPLVRGVVSYAIIWPTSSIIQQSFVGNNSEYDFKQAIHFGLFGALYVAPTLHCWMKVSRFLMPKPQLRMYIARAIVEQLTYAPFLLSSFFCCMPLLEGKTFEEAKENVKQKLFPTYKMGLCYWPFLQTINYAYITEANRLPFLSVCSLGWTCFLAYMHQRQERDFTSN